MEQKTIRKGRVRGLYEKRGWYYFRPPTPKGGERPKPVALKTKDYVEAVGKAIKLGSKTEVDRAAMRGTVDEVLPKYYRAKSEDSGDTKRVRVMILTNFSKVLGNPKLASIDAELMAEWRERLSTTGGTLESTKPLSPATMKSYLVTVKAFINWCRTEGLIEGDPLSRLKRQTRIMATKVQEFHTELEREKAFQVTAPAHIELTMLLGYLAGLRDGEMLAVNPAWIWLSPDKTRGTISVQDTIISHDDGSMSTWKPKGRRKRVIPMHPRLVKFFKKHGCTEPWAIRPDKIHWPKDDKQSKRYDARKGLERVAKNAGLKKLNFHIMRHTFATLLAMKGTPLATVAALLGDSLKVTEDHYAGFCPARENPVEVL